MVAAKKAKSSETKTETIPEPTTRKELLRRAIMDTCLPDGSTTPERVFDAAKNPNNPLHGEFIWDGDAAVRELGMQTAARLIRTLKVEVVIDTIKIAAPSFVSDPRENDVRNYVPLKSVKQDPEISKGVMLDELARIEGAINRARSIAGFLEAAEEFENMLGSIMRIRARVGMK